PADKVRRDQAAGSGQRSGGTNGALSPGASVWSSDCKVWRPASEVKQSRATVAVLRSVGLHRRFAPKKKELGNSLILLVIINKSGRVFHPARSAEGRCETRNDGYTPFNRAGHRRQPEGSRPDPARKSPLAP